MSEDNAARRTPKTPEQLAADKRARNKAYYRDVLKPRRQALAAERAAKLAAIVPGEPRDAFSSLDREPFACRPTVADRYAAIEAVGAMSTLRTVLSDVVATIAEGDFCAAEGTIVAVRNVETDGRPAILITTEAPGDLPA